jgi:hypothetical protein
MIAGVWIDIQKILSFIALFSWPPRCCCCRSPSPAAHAHTRVEVGPYALIVGWVSEPPIVGERNALYIEILENEQPLTGAEATLDGELQYGDRTFRVNLNPTSEPGIYHAELFPTVRGQYALRLFGTLGETDVDETIEPEEVFAASRLHFPEPQPDPRDLQQEIAQLQSDLQTARALAIGGLLVGVDRLDHRRHQPGSPQIIPFGAVMNRFHPILLFTIILLTIGCGSAGETGDLSNPAMNMDEMATDSHNQETVRIPNENGAAIRITHPPPAAISPMANR